MDIISFFTSVLITLAVIYVIGFIITAFVLFGKKFKNDYSVSMKWLLTVIWPLTAFVLAATRFMTWFIEQVFDSLSGKK